MTVKETLPQGREPYSPSLDVLPRGNKLFFLGRGDRPFLKAIPVTRARLETVVRSGQSPKPSGTSPVLLHEIAGLAEGSTVGEPLVRSALGWANSRWVVIARILAATLFDPLEDKSSIGEQ